MEQKRRFNSAASLGALAALSVLAGVGRVVVGIDLSTPKPVKKMLKTRRRRYTGEELRAIRASRGVGRA